MQSNILKKISFIILLIFLLSTSAFSWNDWKTLKTEYFTVYYKHGYEIPAKEALKLLEYYRPNMEKIIGNRNYNLPVVIEDTGSLSNGFSSALTNTIHLYVYPPSSNELGYSQNWLSLVGTHEYVHSLQLTKTGGIPKILKDYLGNMLLPNFFLPGWIIEGITVYSESQISEFQGRLNDGYYNAFIKARIYDSSFPSIISATYSPFEYPSYRGSYLYGGMFLNYLSNQYGEDKFAKFFEFYSSSSASYIPLSFPSLNLDKSAINIYGKSFSKLWEEWQKYETEQAKDFKIYGEKLTNKGWEIEDLKIYNNKLFYKNSYSIKTGSFDITNFTEIVALDLNNKKEEVIVSTTSFFTAPMKIINNKLYYTVAEMKSGYANSSMQTYGFYSILHEKNLESGIDKIIFDEDNLRAFEILPDGNIIYSKNKNQSFGCKMWIYEIANNNKKLVYDGDYLIDELVYHENHLIVTAKKDWENFSIYNIDLNTFNIVPVVNTPYQESHISINDNKMYFKANYEKIYSSYFYDFSTQKINRLTENGFADYPIFNKRNNTLYFIGLNSNGNDIYFKSIKNIDFSLPTETSNSPKVILEENTITHGDYKDNLKSLYPPRILRLPIIYADNTKTMLGVFFIGTDDVGEISEYYGSLYYDSKNLDPQVSLSLIFNYFAPLSSSVTATNIDKRQIDFDLMYPLIQKISPGLSELLLGASYKFENHGTQQIAPYLLTKYTYPKTKFELNFQIPVEDKKIGSKINRTGLYTDFAASQIIYNSKFKFKFRNIYDPDYQDEIFTLIRGYSNSLNEKRKNVINLEYTKSLIKIRKGFWQPNIFFEDLTGLFFTDNAIAYSGKDQLSSGLELHLETKTFTLVSLDLGIRIVINKDNKINYEFFIYSEK